MQFQIHSSQDTNLTFKTLAILRKNDRYLQGNAFNPNQIGNIKNIFVVSQKKIQ